MLVLAFSPPPFVYVMTLLSGSLLNYSMTMTLYVQHELMQQLAALQSPSPVPSPSDKTSQNPLPLFYVP